MTKNRVHMQINQISNQLKALISEKHLIALAKTSGFQVRHRCLSIVSLLKAVFKSLSCLQDANLSDIHQNLKTQTDCTISYKPFHNQIRKPALTELLRELVIQAMSKLTLNTLDKTFFIQRGIQRVLLQDGSSFALHDELAQVFAGRFTAISPAAIELHVTYDLFNEQPCEIDIRPDVETERAFLPGSHTLEDTLLLADAGYFDLDYFEQVSQDGGYFLVRANKNINPIVTSAYCAGIELKEKNIKLKTLLEKFASQPLELTVRWKKNGPEYRLIYLPDEKRPVFLVTNLKEAQFNFDELLDIYATRWQIELFFKELKSWNNLKGFITRDPHIAESLVWLSILQTLIKRFICHSAATMFRCAISTFRASKCSYLWLDDILDCIEQTRCSHKIHRVLELLAVNCKRQSIEKESDICRFKIGSHAINVP